MKDNKTKITIIIDIGDPIMKKFVTFIQDVLLINNNDSHRVGLSQFREKSSKEDFSVNKNSIVTGEVKLSDLLRRA